MATGRMRGVGAGEANLRLREAERDGTLQRLASTYSPDNDAIYDGMSRAERA